MPVANSSVCGGVTDIAIEVIQYIYLADYSLKGVAGSGHRYGSGEQLQHCLLYF
jgi:hypothetical protein